jgi:hypothetical protein
MLGKLAGHGPNLTWLRLKVVEEQTQMRKILLAMTLIATALLSACWNESPKTVVVLVDATKSIDPTEYERCRGELSKLTRTLGRGDRLVLVPITGEPEELLGHRIVHIEMPSERVPYDSNLKKAKAEAAQRIKQFLRDLPQIQAKRTDIIGALRASADAFRAERSELVCLSDMVEDDERLTFPTAREISDVKSAEALAERLAPKGFLKGVIVKIGILKSFDLERMNPERRDAIKAFWRKYFVASGASEVRLTVDLETLGE